MQGERVLALDPSSACVGWSLFEAGELARQGKYIQQGEKGRHGQKLDTFRVWLDALLIDLHPDRLLYEAPYQGRMKHTFGILSRYVGIIEAVHFWHFGYEIPPNDAVPAHTVKRAIGAKRGANHEDNKVIVLKLVNARYGINLKYKKNDRDKKTTQDDIADAIAVNWAWHELYRAA